MNNLETTLKKIASRKRRVRARISGSAVRPRLCVHVSNKHITAQLINDETSTTIAFVSSVNHAKDSGTMTEKAVLVGTEIAKKAKAKKVRVGASRN